MGLERHIQTVHENRRDFPCALCSYAASAQTTLDTHVRSAHIRVRKDKCAFCDYKAKDPSVLKNHLRRIHNDDQSKRTFECSHCGFGAMRQCDLTRHVKQLHTDRHGPDIKTEVEIDNQCELCEFKAGDPSTLKAHLKAVHLRIKSNKCPECDYAAFRSNHLKQHIQNVHEKEKQVCVGVNQDIVVSLLKSE